MKQTELKEWNTPTLNVLDVDQTLSAGWFRFHEGAYHGKFLNGFINHLGTPVGS